MTRHFTSDFGAEHNSQLNNISVSDALHLNATGNMPLCFQYDVNTGALVVSRDNDASTTNNNVAMGRSFTSDFGCDRINYAVLYEQDLNDLTEENKVVEGHAYCLDDVVRITASKDLSVEGNSESAIFALNCTDANEFDAKSKYIVTKNTSEGNYVVIERTFVGECRVIPNVEVIPSPKDSYGVGKGVIESPILKDTSVLMLGCGSLGGDVTMHLAQAGVGKFLLVDPDRVEASNLARLGFAGINDVAHKKVDVLARRIKGKNANCQVEKISNLDITINPTIMNELLSKVDLAIVSTDNRTSRLLFADAVKIAQKPCIYVRCLSRAESGEVFVSRADSACFKCFYGSDADSQHKDEVDDWVQSKKNGRLAAYCRPEDMGVYKILPGISVDISSISVFAARLALWELAKTLKENDDPFIQFKEEFSKYNFFTFVNRRENIFKDIFPFDNSGKGMCPQRWYGAVIPKDNACSCCNDDYEDQLDIDDEFDINKICVCNLIS